MAAASRASPQHARPGSTFSNPRNAAPPGSPGGDQDAGSKRRYGHGGALLTMPKRALFRRSSRQPQPSTRMTARVAGRTATSHWRSAGPHHHHGARSHRCRWPGARARAGAACETGQAARAAGPSCHANPAACRIRPSARWPAPPGRCADGTACAGGEGWYLVPRRRRPGGDAAQVDCSAEAAGGLLCAARAAGRNVHDVQDF